MKITIVRTLFTTGASLIILAVFFAIIGEKYLPIHRIFEIFGANIVINFGIHIRNKFEIRYFILEFMADVGYIVLVLLVFGFIFDWISTVPAWYIVIMAVVIYLFAVITTAVKIHKDTKEINDLLQKRREKI